MLYSRCGRKACIFFFNLLGNFVQFFPWKCAELKWLVWSLHWTCLALFLIVRYPGHILNLNNVEKFCEYLWTCLQSLSWHVTFTFCGVCILNLYLELLFQATGIYVTLCCNTYNSQATSWQQVLLNSAFLLRTQFCTLFWIFVFVLRC